MTLYSFMHVSCILIAAMLAYLNISCTAAQIDHLLITCAVCTALCCVLLVEGLQCYTALSYCAVQLSLAVQLSCAVQLSLAVLLVEALRCYTALSLALLLVEALSHIVLLFGAVQCYIALSHDVLQCCTALTYCV